MPWDKFESGGFFRTFMGVYVRASYQGVIKHFSCGWGEDVVPARKMEKQGRGTNTKRFALYLSELLVCSLSSFALSVKNDPSVKAFCQWPWSQDILMMKMRLKLLAPHPVVSLGLQAQCCPKTKRCHDLPPSFKDSMDIAVLMSSQRLLAPPDFLPAMSKTWNQQRHTRDDNCGGEAHV